MTLLVGWSRERRCVWNAAASELRRAVAWHSGLCKFPFSRARMSDFLPPCDVGAGPHASGRARSWGHRPGRKSRGRLSPWERPRWLALPRADWWQDGAGHRWPTRSRREGRPGTGGLARPARLPPKSDVTADAGGCTVEGTQVEPFLLLHAGAAGLSPGCRPAPQRPGRDPAAAPSPQSPHGFPGVEAVPQDARSQGSHTLQAGPAQGCPCLHSGSFRHFSSSQTLPWEPVYRANSNRLVGEGRAARPPAVSRQVGGQEPGAPPPTGPAPHEGHSHDPWEPCGDRTAGS